MDPNTILTELQLQKTEVDDDDDGQIYYTILQDDAEVENLTLKSEDTEYLDSNNIFYLSFKESDAETTETLVHQDESTNSEEASDVNMEFLEQVTLPDGTKAYMKREPTNDNSLLKVKRETVTIDDSKILLRDLNEGFESITNENSDTDDNSLDASKDIGGNVIFTQEGDEDINLVNYEQIQLEDGTIAMIEKDLYNKIVEQNKNKETNIKNNNIKNEQPSSSSGTLKSFICPQENCNKSYTTLHHLRVHMRNHTGHRPYKCVVVGCEKTFATGYSLKAHSRTHTGEKPYACKNCLKCFKTSGDLQKHNRIHTGEKPFLCPIEGCGRSFTTSNIRKVHVRSHTGERPFKCPEPGCNKAFASATNYKNHVRIHSGEKPYKCSHQGCGKRFTEYSSLYKHQTVHTNVKASKCEYCGREFRQPSTLVSHKRTLHNIIITDNGTEIMVKMVEQDNEDEINVEEHGLAEGEMQFFFVAQTE